MTESSEHFGVGTVSGPPGSVTHEILHECDRETYERYDQALGHAVAPTYRFAAKLVELNFQSYLNHEKFAGTLVGLGRNFGNSGHRPVVEAVTSQIVNWLTSFRLYLDYAETSLKRQFGGDSEQYMSFKQRTSDAYDNHVGYRFIYKFRNYVQHCGPPISSLSVSRPEEEHDNPFIKQTVAFLLNRNDLLDSFDWGAIVREDLLSMGQTFELRPLGEAAMGQLREIEWLLLDIALAEGARTVSDLREALGYIPPDAPGAPALFRFTTSGEEPNTIITLTPQSFSREMVQQYESVASGEITPADLHAPATQPPQAIFDPASVREHFRRDSRAVQAMSLWQAEQGGTSVFLEGVNGIIQEDGGVDVLLTGMFNMTAILLHMTAAALGVRPDGLLG